jgi:hypothetical protein
MTYDDDCMINLVHAADGKGWIHYRFCDLASSIAAANEPVINEG